MLRSAALLSFALLAACGAFPSAGDPTGSGDYPQLLPFGTLLADVPPAGEAGTDAGAEPRPEDEALLDRAADLRSRADALLDSSP